MGEREKGGAGREEGGRELEGMQVPREQGVTEGVIIGSSASGVTGSCEPSEGVLGTKLQVSKRAIATLQLGHFSTLWQFQSF